MGKEQKQYTRRIRNLVFIFVITAIIVTVSTYAWFIGMKTVNVSEFQVEVAGTESLWLSVDGKTFGPTVTINKDNFDTYTGNSNTWGGEDGLVPMSSVGVVNPASSRLELYEKASLTPSPGGYRLIASKVPNDVIGEDDALVTEPNGYVAFDLFIRNHTGRQYLDKLDPLTEESIYLTVDSSVRVSDLGEEETHGVDGTGIENSVRVAFAQIGRVKGTVDVSDEESEGTALVRGITCTDVPSGADPEVLDVTGICRNAQIWEPNDSAHEKDAISYYDYTCIKRKAEGTDVRDKDSFEISEGNKVHCGQVVDGQSYPTYAINNVITADDNVDVYDGKAYNSYEATTKLSAYPTFTDTMKLKAGTERPEFMSLAPNSITKIRVYIYIEGQDIDNYDFAAIGKAIKVKFGFTKQRLTEADTGYEGPDINQGQGPNGTDKTAPVIKVTDGEGNDVKVINHTLGETFTAPEATATDNKDASVTVTLINKVNINVAGEYTLIYRAIDLAGNVAAKTVKVLVG